MNEPPGAFTVEWSTGTAHDFHHRPLELESTRPAVWIHRVDRRAIVLGSSQSVDVLDRSAAEAAGWEVSGRRSGGGIVVIEPGESCWIDVVIHRSDDRWSDDVNAAFAWVGDWWCRALASLGVDGLSVHRGRIIDRSWGQVVCFAGLGPGEVVQSAGDGRIRKIVGLSQRRTRDVARFQGLYLRTWNPSPLRSFLHADAVPAGLDIGEVAAGFVGGDGPDPDDVAAAMLASQP